jgi:hypothetical protein
MKKPAKKTSTSKTRAATRKLGATKRSAAAKKSAATKKATATKRSTTARKSTAEKKKAARARAKPRAAAAGKGSGKAARSPLTGTTPGLALAEKPAATIHMLAAAPGRVDWARESPDARMAYAMRVLSQVYSYSVDSAAGIVGNLWAESGVIPNRIEGSAAATPMRTKNFDGKVVDFTPEEVMTRDKAAQRGPAQPGIGLAQWTYAPRRAGLFLHSYKGAILGASILSDMDAQLDYLIQELKSGFSGVAGVLRHPGVSRDNASDEIVYNFEMPGAIWKSGSKRVRTAPEVQAVFAKRRAYAQDAYQAYSGSTATA